MTYQPETTSPRQIFEEALDGLQPQKSDAIVVLRNWDKHENAERVELGVDLLAKGWANIMLLAQEDNTKAESQRMVEIVTMMGWSSLLLVTHRYHCYRAYLTFIQAFKGRDVRLFIKYVPSGIELGERSKIAQYSAIGDCATYETGLEFIEWLILGRTPPS